MPTLKNQKRSVFVRASVPVALVAAFLVFANVAQAVPSGAPKSGKDASATSATSQASAASPPTPVLSGAEPAYPYNHSLDNAPQSKGSIAGADFEAAGGAIGTAPTNSGFETPPNKPVTVPNGNFSTGTFKNWTNNKALIKSNTKQGYFAQLDVTDASIVSSAVTIPSSAQALAYDVGYLETTKYSRVFVYVLSGTTYGTSTLLLEDSCYSCGRWDTRFIDVQAYRTQSVKFKFVVTSIGAAYGAVGVDNVEVQEVFPGWQVSGTYARLVGTDADASLPNGALTSPAFTVPDDADYFTLDAKGTNAYVYVDVAVGPAFGTWTRIAYQSVGSAWSQLRISTEGYVGKQVKLRVQTAPGGPIVIDNVGAMVNELVGWTPRQNDASRRMIETNGNHFAQVTNGSIVSLPFTVPTGAQNISLKARKGDTGQYLSFDLYVLSGSGYATEDHLEYISTLPTSWTDLTFGIGKYEGQSVKLEIRHSLGKLDIDDAGVMQELLPSWRTQDAGGLGVGQDARGTFVTSVGTVPTVDVASSWVNAGVMNATAALESRYYAFGYAFTRADINVTIDVYWNKPDGTKLRMASQTATSIRSGIAYFGIPDDQPDRGFFSLRIHEGAKVYSLGDNIARQQVGEPFSRDVGVGIDTSSGAFAFSERDGSVSGAFPIAFTRYYNSHSDFVGPMGSRWSHSFETRLDFSDATSDVGVVFGSGREEFFDRKTLGNYVKVDPRVQSTLVKNADGTFTFTTKDRLVYAFSGAGVLTRITDANGNAATLAYDGQGQLASVSAPGGSLSMTYDAQGHLVRVADPTGSVDYGFDANGDLRTATDADLKVRSYTYDRHLLATVTDQTQTVVLDNDYDLKLRIIKQTDALAKSILIDYDTPGKGATRVTDALGKQATFYFDRFQRTTYAVDGSGRTVANLYDVYGNLDKIIDPAGNQWDFAFDASGDLNGSIDPLGNPSSFAYNAKHLPTTVTDGRGNVTTLTYDANGNLASTTDPLQHATTYTNNAAGQVLTVTDALGKVTSYTYDAAGNRTSMTNPLGKQWVYTYDAAGHKTSATDPLGNKTRYFYDLLGRLVLIRDPLLRETAFLYDPVGHLLRVTDPSLQQTLWHYDPRGLVDRKTNADGKITLYGYDADHRMTSVTDPLGHATTYGYDAAGRLTSVTDALAKHVDYTYDAAGRLATKTDQIGRVTAYEYDLAGRLSKTTLPNTATMLYGRDPDGRLTSTTDPRGKISTSVFDAAGRLTSTTDPLLHTTSFGYDVDNRMTSETDPLNRVTAYGFDDAGRMTTTTDPLSGVTTYGYDPAGRLSTVKDATNRTSTYGYDAAGQVTSVTDAAGHATLNTYDPNGRLKSVELPSGAKTSYEYNGRGLLTKQINPLGKETIYGYDDAGRPTTTKDPLLRVTTNGYDNANHLTSITDARGGVVNLNYDAAGQMTSTIDARGKTWTYTYSPLGIRKSVLDPLAKLTSYGFDNAGNVTSRTDAKNVVTGYGYDDTGAMNAITYPGGSVGFGYDAGGQQTSMTDPTGTTTWGYDAAGRVTSVAAPAGTVGYSYDPAGRRASMTLPGGRSAAYAYDAAGQLASLTDWAGRAVGFGYDLDGNRTSITRPNGVNTAITYDVAAQIKTITHAKAGATLQSYAYGYDDAGNRTSVITPQGTESYTYDNLNRLTGATYPAGPVLSYTYDPAGNRTSETRAGVTTTYAYNAAGRITTAGSKTFTYDANGNLTKAGTDTFGWNFDNRLVSATVGTHSATYRYDGQGLRTSATVDGTTSPLLLDRAGGLPTIVDDGTSAYLHAGGLVSQVQGAAATYGLTDALGSVRGLSDAAGTLVGSASFEPFGARTSTSGISSRFGFTGEPTDLTGLIDLRARTLDPVTGRFLSADTVSPNAPGTQGYNPYAYVVNNPQTWTDPTGHNVDVADIAPGSAGVAYITALAVAGAEWIAAACGATPIACVLVASFLVVGCVLYDPCFGLAQGTAAQFANGSTGTDNQLTDAEGAVYGLPEPPVVEEPDPSPVGVPIPPGTLPGGQSRRPVVIGENGWSDESAYRRRVIEAAARFGADYFDPLWVPAWPPELRLDYNRAWIVSVMNQGREILDIGPSSERWGYPECSSLYYCMEVYETRNYRVRVVQYPGGGWFRGYRIIPARPVWYAA